MSRIGRPANRPEDVWKQIDVRGSDECWPWSGVTRGRGYGDFKIANRHHVAHRVAYQNATGIDPGSLLVCHTCDNPPCCNPAHLFLGTHADNMRDRDSKGRGGYLLGARNPAARLTELQVKDIRQRHSSGTGIRTLAREFGIVPSGIHGIVSGRLWRHA